MFLMNEFMQGLAEYIKKNYSIYSHAEIPEGIVCEKSALYTNIPKRKELTKNQSVDLQHLLDEVGDSFHEKLFEFIDNSGMTASKYISEQESTGDSFPKSEVIRRIIRERIPYLPWR